MKTEEELWWLSEKVLMAWNQRDNLCLLFLVLCIQFIMCCTSSPQFPEFRRFHEMLLDGVYEQFVGNFIHILNLMKALNRHLIEGLLAKRRGRQLKGSARSSGHSGRLFKNEAWFILKFNLELLIGFKMSTVMDECKTMHGLNDSKQFGDLWVH